MQAKFNVQGKERKALVNVLSELTLTKPIYKGVPTCAYEVGNLTLDKNGTLLWDEKANPTAMKILLEQLANRGYTAESEKEEPMNLTVAMPRSLFTPETWENLNNLLAAKGKLIQKALGLKDLPDAIEEEENVTFPWFTVDPQDADLVEAYSRFVCAICDMARKQKKVSAKEKPAVNEKYAFRCFLLRLGFIGEDFKKVRKVLLRNLTGNAAWKEVKSKNEQEG